MIFADAFAEWKDLAARRLDNVEFERFESIEAELLSHKPAEASEAAGIVDVLLANGGERSDARDREALLNVRSFLLERC